MNKKNYVTRDELEKYSLEIQQWMTDQVLLNYSQGKRITKLEHQQQERP